MPKKNDIYIYSKKIIGFFAVFVMLLLAMLAFFFQSRVSMEMQTMEKVSFHNNSILVYFFLVCMVTGLFVFRKRIEKIDSRKLYLFLSIIMFAVGMILVLGAGTDLRADALKIYESAKAFSKGDYSALEKGNYLYHYPHQLGMVSYEWLLLKIVDNVEVFFLANLLFVLFNIYILGEISYCLFDSQFVHNITLFLSFLFFPQLFFILFAYGTIPGFSMLLAAYYFQLIFLRKGTKKYFLLFVACACLSCLFKNNYLIGVLASFAVFILYAMKKKKCKFIAFAIISLICVIVSGKLLNFSYEGISNKTVSAGEPKILWVAMGLRDESVKLGGWYDGYNKQTYTDCGYDDEVASNKAKDSIKNSINLFLSDPGYALNFFQDKIESTWCDPLFESIWSGPLEDCGQKVNDQGLKRIYSEGIYHSIIRDFCGAELIFIYVTAFFFSIKCFRSRTNARPDLLLGFIFLIGGFLFHLIWETKSQYVYPYVFLLIPYSAYIFSKWCNKAQIILERNASHLQKEEKTV